MTLTFRQRLLTSTLLVGAAAMATPAWAQEAPPSVPTEENTEPAISSVPDSTPGPTELQQTEETEARGDIIVTGSRIPRPDLSSTSPLTVVNDEEFRLSGTVNVEQVVNTLPSVIPGATAFSNNPGGGVATINLRGLGSTRNLVLVNGRRYIFFDTSQVVDVNTIPAFLIDSVDVVTGGASAVYGSDALAGVVNFKLRGVTGAEFGAQANITEEGDGRRMNVWGALGTDFADGRGNVTLFGEYYRRKDIFQSDRDFSFFALSDGAGDTGQTADFGDPVPGLVPGGSAGVPQGRFVAVGGAVVGNGTNFCGGTAVTCPGTFGLGAFFDVPGDSRPFVPASAGPDNDTYNYAPSNYLMVPQERFTLGGYGEYEISDAVTAYFEGTFINNRVENELAPTPVTQNVDFQIAAIDDFLSADDLAQIRLIAARQQQRINQGIAGFGPITAGTTTFPALATGCDDPDGAGPLIADPATCDVVRLQVNTRVAQISNRNASDDRNAYRILGGVKGNITDSLTYDLYYFYARTRNSQIQEGNVSRTQFFINAANGTCNFFGAGQLSDECIDNISILAQNTDISTLQVAQGSVAGPLFNLPWSTSPVAFAAGVEWRKMGGEFIPDTALSSGDVVGFNAGNPTEGDYNAKEVFGEINVPIIQDNFIHKLEFTGAVRFSDYSLENVGGVWSYAAGVELAPVQDITFRAQYQRAVRAPNVSELFGGQSIGFPPATDPCAVPANASNPTIVAVCEATGVPAGSVGNPSLQPNVQIQGAFGGNPLLEEEVGDTITVGAVIRPRWVPRLNLTVDYYDIEIENVIAAAGGGVNNILNLCYNVIQNASSAICGLISRDPTGVISGPPFVVTATQANLGLLATEGFDFSVDYSLPLNFSLLGNGRSRLSAYFLGNYTTETDVTPLADLPDDVIECAGRFGLNCGDPVAKWKWNTRFSWQDGPLTSTLRWRHLGKVRDDDDDTDFIVERIKAYDLFDLAFAFDVNDNMRLNLGVNNLFDKKPPVIGSNQEQANTYPGTYDVLGRDFFASVNLRF
jgi:iron complex outermembrane recepter protein